MAVGVYSLTALTLPVIPGVAGPHGRATAPAAAAPLRARIEQMDAMVRRFSDAAKAHGGGAVHHGLAGYLHRPVAGWLHTPAPEPVHHQLLAGAARLTLLLGTMTADDGHDALAQHYHLTATRMAADAEDTALFAIALRTMATHASDLGHHTRGVLHLSEHAADTARRSSRSVRAYTQAHLATAAAHHDRHTALTALGAAERLHEQADSLPGPFTAYPLAALHYQRAQTLGALGDRTGAVGAYTAALRLRTPAERHANALTRAALAESLLAQGHLDVALAHWSCFLDDCPHLHSARVGRSLEAMRQLLTPHKRYPSAALVLDRASLLR
ncbi:hypothetical protein [Streptomyces sp. NPDC059003]|uniref:hypothetical protein n=1 Tax=Streptomyces sp. NPDC059003 TaxID=3346691 RepID=UPI00367E61DC